MSSPGLRIVGGLSPLSNDPDSVKTVATHEAKTHHSALWQEVCARETIVISRGKKPLAKLVPIEKTAARPKVGEMMDEPFAIPDEALQSLNEADMKLWGLS